MKMNLFGRVVVSASLLQATFLVSALAQDVQIVKAEAAAPVVVSEPQIVTQPTTVVEDSPLVKSRAEQLRNARQGAEIDTERKIVEKLEEARLKDEEKRLKALFGDKLDAKDEEKKEEAAKVEPVAQPIVVAPAPVVEKQDEKQAVEQVDPAALKAEITESVRAELKKDEVQSEKPETRMTISGGLGFINYNAVNIRSDFAGAFGLGYEVQKNLGLEFGFMYSRHLVQESLATFQEFDQYNVSAGVRYGIGPFAVRPVVGATMSYTRRTYSFPYWANSGEINTNAIDVGLMVGAEADLGHNMMVSFEYRRFMNVQNNIENNDILNLSTNQRLEDLDYDVAAIALKFLF